MTRRMIDELKECLHEACKQDSNVFGYAIWTHHMVAVIEYAKELSRRTGADEEIVEIAAILHDYASVKDAALYKDHHIHGALEAELLLKSYQYPEAKIKKVQRCIREHRGSENIKQSTKESICVASADAMAHIANVPSLLHLAYVKKSMPIDQGANWVLSKIKRSYSKLCPEAKELVVDQYQAALTLLSGHKKGDTL